MEKLQYEIIVKSIGKHCHRYVVVSDENNIDYALGKVKSKLEEWNTQNE